MLGTQYEEYSRYINNLPFTLKSGIVVTPTRYNQAANWHDNIEIQLCTKGQGVVMMDEKRVSVKEGEVAVVNSNILHHNTSSELMVYTCLIVDTQFCRLVDIDPISLHFSSKIKSEVLAKHIEELTNVYHDENDVCRIAKLNSILLRILIELRRNHTVLKKDYTIKSQSFEAVKSAIKYIRTNYKEKIYLDDISKSVFMDKYSLSHRFKQLTGMTVVQYINNYRCKKAADCIADGISVSDAARMCGFTNMSFFTKTFKLYMGCLPSKYRI